MLKVKLFGMLKTLVPGGKELGLDLPAGSQIHDLVAKLQSENPDLGDLLLKKKVLVSVNQEIAHWDTVLSDTDEIALLPPFAGGT